MVQTKAILHHMTKLSGTKEKIKEWKGKAAALTVVKSCPIPSTCAPKSKMTVTGSVLLGPSRGVSDKQTEPMLTSPATLQSLCNPEASAKVPHVFLHALKDIFDQSSGRDLLQRCKGNSQNAKNTIQKPLSVVVVYRPSPSTVYCRHLP